MRTKIVIYGATKEQRKIIHSVAQFMASELFARYQVRIDFHLKKLDDNAYGYCVHKYDNYKPRDFQIELEKSLSNELLVETIIHEMIHIEQMVTEKLKYRYHNIFDIKQLWYDKDFSNADYDKQPWEKDAYKREKVYMKKLAKVKTI
jgi:hypothetical protein